MNDNADNDPRLFAIPDIHGHAKGEHKAFSEERPIPLSARMLFLWFYHACRRGWPRFLMVTDHMNYLTFEDPAAINLVRRALKLAQAGDLHGAAETASVEVGHAAVVSDGLRRGMRYSIGAEVDNDPRSRPDAQNIVDAMKPDGMIRSVHFLSVDHPAHGPNWSWPFDNPEFADMHEIVGTTKTWELYMAALLDAVEHLPGNILGHFYVPASFGNWPDDAQLDAYENQIVDACEARGMAIEFNTRFLYRDHTDEEKAKYLAAHRRLLVKCKAKNVGIAVGSDAHSPKDQGRAFETVLALLDECEINELVFPIGGRLLRVALRVERKVEPPAPEPAPATVADDRKPVRKARAAADAPVRARDASSKRDDATSDESGAPAEDAPAPKSKARPKRVKLRGADVPDDDVAAAGQTAAAVTLDVRETIVDVRETIVEEVAVFDASVVESSVADSLVTDAVIVEEPPVDVPGLDPSIAETDPESAVSPAPAVASEPAVAAEPVAVSEPVAPAEAAISAGAPPAKPRRPRPSRKSVTPAAQPASAVPPVAPETTPHSVPAIAAETPEEPPVVVEERIVTAPADAHAMHAAPPPAPVRRKAPVRKAKSGAAAKAVAPAARAKTAIKKTSKPPAKAVKKAAPKPVRAKKSAPKKAVAKKVAAKKAPAKKTPVRKAAPKKVTRAPGAKKTAVKKAAAKKSSGKKAAPKRR